MALINLNNKIFPFSRTPKDEASRYCRNEMESLVKFLQDQINVIISVVNSQNVGSSITSLESSFQILSQKLTFLSVEVDKLKEESIEEVSENNLLQLNLSFTGTFYVAPNKALIIPDGFNNNGTIENDGVIIVI